MEAKRRLSSVSSCFFGYLFTRAWIGIVFQTANWTDSPVASSTLMEVFDAGLIAAYLFGSLAARRLAPLASRGRTIAVSAALMLFGTAVIAASILLQLFLPLLLAVAMLFSGVGYALVFLQWSEIYGVCSPAQVALFYSGAKVLADLLVFIISDHSMPFLLLFALLLPFLGGYALHKSKQKLSMQNVAFDVQWSDFSFPWKPLLLMGVFGFAFGFGTVGLDRVDSAVTTLATDVPALLICASVLFAWRYFDFNIMYYLTLPLIIVGCFVFPAIPGVPDAASGFCLRASYVSILILVMTALANLSRRYHISAMWLFGMQGFAHYASILLGKACFFVLDACVGLSVIPETRAVVLGVGAAIIATMGLRWKSWTKSV